MKTGFGRKDKAKAKKAQKAKKKAAGKDVEMADVEVQDVDASKQEAPQEQNQGGRTSHQAKVELKRALKVKVAAFKQARSKITRLPGNKTARKQLSENIKETVDQQRALAVKPAIRVKKDKKIKMKKTGIKQPAAPASNSMDA